MEKGHAPRNEALRGCYTDSFAYVTLKDRVPVIVARIVDSLVVRRTDIINDLKNSITEQDIKDVIERLSGLRYELTTNKNFKPLSDDYSDVQVWNSYLMNEINSGSNPRWFMTTWMYAETYAYRRIFEAFQLTPSFKEFDYFLHLKSQQIASSLSNMEAFHKVFHFEDSKQSCREMFEVFLKLSLWGNQCDLSISSGRLHEDKTQDYKVLISDQDKFLLINDVPQVWDYCQTSEGDLIDIILDNSGLELFTDLCLADFLIANGFAKHVRFHVKAIPWFISDVTSNDFIVMFDAIRDHKNLSKSVTKWESYLEEGTWSIHADPFWTYPHNYCKLNEMDKNLFSELSASKLVIFKGDLNYRKVVGDRNWDPTLPFRQALEGLQFLSLLCLRTMKADTVVGLSETQVESTRSKDKDWMVNGKWGLISFNRKEEK